MSDAQAGGDMGWVVPDHPDWRLCEREVDGVQIPYLEFSFGATCACWVRLRLEPDEHRRLDGDARAVERFIRQVENDEARYRHRLDY